MKKIFIFLILGLFLISLASAEVAVITHQNETYVEYEIDNGAWKWLPDWMGGETLGIFTKDYSENSLTKSTAGGHGEFFVESKLIDDINFYYRSGELANGEMEDVKIYYAIPENISYSNKIYNITCQENEPLENGTITTSCNKEFIEYNNYTQEEYNFKEYNGELILGKFKWKLIAKKPINIDVDWVLTVLDTELLKWDWWDNDWEYKRNITAMDGTISSLYNISYYTGMKSDFSDIRFIDYDTELTELNYTIINKIDSSTAMIRVDNENETEIYMYYGNSGASTTSSFDNVYYAPEAGWIFDNANADDETTNSHDGTITGATYTSSGYIGGAYNFDGNDYISIPDAASLRFTTDMTACMWSKTTAANANTYAVGKYDHDTGDRDYGLVGGNGGTFRFNVGDGSSVQKSYETSFVTNTGNWVHFCATFEDGTMKLYVNGTEDTSVNKVTDNILTSIHAGTSDLTIGARLGNNVPENYWTGTLDEIKLYDRVLSATEIEYLYEETAPSFSVGGQENLSSDNPPKIDNPLPINDTTYTTTTTVNFNATVSDDINLVNVSLKIDGLVDQTNSSGFNNTLYKFSKSLATGEHNWSLLACDNSSQCNETETRILNISIISPTITLYQPVDSLISDNLTHDFIGTVYDNTGINNVSLYINSVLNETDSSGLNNTNYTFTKTFTDGVYNWFYKAYDNMGYATDSETRTLTIDTTPFINFTSPTLENNSNSTKPYIEVNTTITEKYFKNISFNFYKDGSLNESITFTDATRLYNKTDVSDGIWNFNVTACTTTNKCNSTETRYTNLELSAPEIIITSPIGTYDYLIENYTLDLNWSVYDVAGNLDSCWYVYQDNKTFKENGINGTGSEEILGYIYVDDNSTQKYYVVSPIVPNVASEIKIYYSVDQTASYQSFQTDGLNGYVDIDVSSGWHLVTWNGGVFGGSKAYLEEFNVNNENYIKEINLVNCLLNTTEFNYSVDENIITFFSNDTFGNIGSNSSTWEYKVLEVSQTFNNETIEGSLEDFLATIRLGSGFTISGSAIVDYNGNETIGESFVQGDDTILRKIGFVVPNIENTTNATFYWKLVLSDSTNINLTEQTQLINPINIDDCSVYTNKILNFSVLDEEFQTGLPNATIEISTNIYDRNKNNRILNFSNTYNGTQTLSICLDQNITGTTSLLLDTIVRYEEEDHANEYYNIVNKTLDNSTEADYIMLYDLNLNDSTEFQLTFTGADFLPVENALVYVDRQYISENTFKTVELPKTDYNGQTILHLVRNDVIYNIRIIQDGIVLGNFENLVAFCDDFTIGDCNIEFNAFDSVEGIFNYDTDLGITFTQPEYDNSSSSISFNFLSSDGTSKNVKMEVTRNDIFGNISICNSSVLSSGGTLSCVVPDNIEESVLKTSIYVEEELTSQGSVSLPSTSYGVGGYLIFVIFILSFSLMFASTKERGSKTGVLVSVILSFAGAAGLGLIRSDVIGLGASGLWLLVIIIVGIFKLNNWRKS